MRMGCVVRELEELLELSIEVAVGVTLGCVCACDTAAIEQNISPPIAIVVIREFIDTSCRARIGGGFCDCKNRTP